ncbi:hypothetical protein [Helicobacter typhlonius]|uniref:hypothetical protein n=1 Tax=Helicobacter typhlonius TaxID=76936 RepID=UPI002FE03BE9
MIFRQIKLYHNGKVVRLGQLFGISIYAFYRDMAKKIHFVNPKQLGITPPPPPRKRNLLKILKSCFISR